MENDIIVNKTKYNGTGHETVYVYTFESLTKRRNRNKGMIKMKIGMTTQRNPLDRIKQQIGASGHEKVILFHIYKTHKGHFFEKTIHKKLKSLGRHLKKDVAIGREWFWVKEKELEKMLHESNKEVNKAFPRDTMIVKSSGKFIKAVFLLALPTAFLLDLTSLAVPAFFMSFLGLFMKDDS